ncbi:ankyrin repeat and sterile alpha motif domain-containing protein 1 [Holotrichia oblita]|uniref:Ankyrin repeat and sterile alpha motif domain-containing protein 1 n=1 Tax=Holotrichia oblita TaxID=644536 RepID=A0ACB9TAR9_HOLOL|nr:ankyrin repeat and sterile alpha motif domain-containing protein 1 [Holotrichia oblita]
MVHYTFEEYRDMIMCRSNSYEAQRIYRERYLLRQVPNVRTFIDVHRRLREDGCFRKPKLNSGVSRTRRTVRNEETLLRMVENNPRTSTRKTSSAIEPNWLKSVIQDKRPKISKNQNTTGLFRHSIDTGHKFKFNDTEVLDVEQDTRKSLILFAFGYSH